MSEERSRRWIRLVAAALGATGVAAAAFGAHGLEKIAEPGQVRFWAIGAALQLVTAPTLLAFFAVGTRVRLACSLLLVLGVVLFSGSLYAMALGAPRILGAVTPLGGLSMLTAWILVAFPAKEEDE